ncbi:MAG TPA: extracellular matrix/biofilm biosynthesis regulator RemA family protein [bacterium]|nr:extracellular matrix/biofilm biosynthesis regulator RemA family protein [bacterium]
MYVHVGGDVVLLIPDIVGIFDARMMEGSADNERFMERARAQGRMRVEVPHRDRKAIVVTTGGVYQSAISPVTLVRRVTNAGEELRRPDG